MTTPAAILRRLPKWVSIPLIVVTCPLWLPVAFFTMIGIEGYEMMTGNRVGW